MKRANAQKGRTLDVRVAYLGLAAVGLVAVAALGAVAAGERVAGRRVDEAAATATAPPPGARLQELAPGKMLDTSGLGVTIDEQPPVKPLVRGSAPVSLEDAPVGPSEARVAFRGLSDDNTLDMGLVDPRTPAEAQVEVLNVGTADLVIREAGGSCGCTAVLVDRTVVPPGEAATLRVKYDPRVNQEFGQRVQKKIHVRSNDPLVPTAQFTLTAEVGR